MCLLILYDLPINIKKSNVMNLWYNKVIMNKHISIVKCFIVLNLNENKKKSNLCEVNTI